MEQVTIRFDAGLTESYPTLRECVAARVHAQHCPAKAIAADLDISPSDLSRKLAPQDRDAHRNFDIDMLVRFIEVTGDTTPVDWLVERFYSESDEMARLKARLAELELREHASGQGTLRAAN